jgi:hypothetical protein
LKELNFLQGLENASQVFTATWKDPEKEKKDPRYFVVVEEPDRVLVFWGTKKVHDTLAPELWPGIYRQRIEIQENSFKRMIDHGALNTNYGRKRIMAPDRHHQRKQEKLEEKLEKAKEEVEKKESEVEAQREKVCESIEKEHKKRLTQRQRGLEEKEEKLNQAKQKEETIQQQIEEIGPQGERADRDFRKQKIMTFRTLLLENELNAFMIALWGYLTEKVSLESILSMLFERSGTRIETSCEIIYLVNPEGLSLPYQRKLSAVVKGLNAMAFTHRGKPVRVCLRRAPP